ncbi:hypothetical protein BJ138DRAFT_1102794 [Hygrophoropsis aurantiaca]|uniref:Uncharacterized protein n=1 Tax=Hygrophoropsis aurantiaca TaxID=72124 RepID=A0ACB8A9C7_9AGAM|nr:hypothetical protein BJ138DRAFT_1102794 [Hygrophoropsis aurantiaca]
MSKEYNGASTTRDLASVFALRPPRRRARECFDGADDAKLVLVGGRSEVVDVDSNSTDKVTAVDMEAVKAGSDKFARKKSVFVFIGDPSSPVHKRCKNCKFPPIFWEGRAPVHFNKESFYVVNAGKDGLHHSRNGKQPKPAATYNSGSAGKLAIEFLMRRSTSSPYFSSFCRQSYRGTNKQWFLEKIYQLSCIPYESTQDGSDHYYQGPILAVICVAPQAVLVPKLAKNYLAHWHVKHRGVEI